MHTAAEQFFTKIREIRTKQKALSDGAKSLGTQAWSLQQALCRQLAQQLVDEPMSSFKIRLDKKGNITITNFLSQDQYSQKVALVAGTQATLKQIAELDDVRRENEIFPGPMKTLTYDNGK